VRPPAPSGSSGPYAARGPAGAGSLDRIVDDLDRLLRLGAETVLPDPYHGTPEETRRPRAAPRALTAVTTHWKTRS